MTGTYYTRTNVKSYLGITDSTDDALLDLLGTTANDNVEQDLFPNADGIPIVSPYLTADVNALADYEVCSEYLASIGQSKKADEWEAKRDKKLASVKASLAAQYVSVSKPAAYAQPYRTDPLHTRTGL